MTNLRGANTHSSFFFFLSLSVCLVEQYLGAPGRGLTGQPLFSRSVLPAWQTIKATHVPGRYTGDMMFWEASFFSRFRQTRTLCSVSVKTSDRTWNLFSVVIPSQAQAGSWWCGVTHRHSQLQEKINPLVWSHERSVCQYSGQTLSCYYELDIVQSVWSFGHVGRTDPCYWGRVFILKE